MERDSGARVIDQLYEVVLLLASEEGQIVQRLAHAYFSRIELMDVSLLPPKVQDKFERVRSALRRMYPERDRIDHVDIDHAVNVAQEIILLYDDAINET